MKTILSFFATVLFSANAFTQTSAEVTCRAQAKEAAVQTYSTCITEARNNKVDEIRKNYQKELTDLKAKYDKELKKMGAGQKQTQQNPKPLKGIAKDLPKKTPVSVSPPLVQTVPEGTKVIAIDLQEPTESPEKDDTQIAQPEFIEMPVE